MPVNNSIILDAAQKMKSPIFIRDFKLDPKNAHPDPVQPTSSYWNDLSLTGGYPALILLFAVLQRSGLLNCEETIHQYVLKVKETIETRSFSDLSLYSGVTGICFSIHQASFDGKRYQRMLATLHDFLLSQLETNYLTPLRENLNLHVPRPAFLYDPISGISGIGRYALEHLSYPGFMKAVLEIVSTLIAICKPLLIKEHNVPGWYLSPTDRLNAINPSQQGTFNLGLAHGVTGILAFLAIASLRGVEVEGQKETMAMIANWIRNKSFMDNRAIQWPYYVTWEEETVQLPPRKESSKDGWCYGVPGIARTLLLASKALNDKELKSFALKAFRDVFTRTREEWGIPGSSLCHGIAGLLLITHEMAKEEGCDDLHSKVNELEKILLSYHHSDFPLGFQDFEPCAKGGFIGVNNLGFLDGSVGILLTLLSLSDSKSTWHLPLLIHA